MDIARAAAGGREGGDEGAKEADRLSTLRLINAAIKDRDIAARGDGRMPGWRTADILAHPGQDGEAAAGKRARL